MDREIVLARVINAPRELVFAAWSDAQHLPQWFGPAGFKIETHEIDVRVGGRWRFDMIAPDGLMRETAPHGPQAPSAERAIGTPR